MIAAVYEARYGAPPEGALREPHAPMLNALLDECLRQVNSPYEKTRALARELLNDWDTCRKRNTSPWPYLAEVLRQRRKGLPAPPLTLAATSSSCPLGTVVVVPGPLTVRNVPAPPPRQLHV